MREHDLEVLFAEAKAQVPRNTEPLLQRVLGDALQVQPRAAAPFIREKNTGGFWANIIGMIGGKTGLAGLGAATALGMFLGFVQPASLMTLTDTFVAQTQIDEFDLVPGIDDILTEG